MQALLHQRTRDSLQLNALYFCLSSQKLTILAKSTLPALAAQMIFNPLGMTLGPVSKKVGITLGHLSSSVGMMHLALMVTRFTDIE